MGVEKASTHTVHTRKSMQGPCCEYVMNVGFTTSRLDSQMKRGNRHAKTQQHKGALHRSGRRNLVHHREAVSERLFALYPTHGNGVKEFLVGRPGLEPGTYGLKVRSSNH